MADTEERDFFRLVTEARNPERLFAVRSNKYCAFYAGHASGAMQVLVGRLRAEKILVLFFSKWGVLYDIQRRQLPRFSRRPEKRRLAVNDEEFREHLLKEFGFKSGLIRVQPFTVSDEECGFWVGPLPWHVNQFLAAPEKHTAEEQAEYRRGIREFIQRNVCVLEWGNDWWVLEADGVEAGWDLPEDPV
jgi:hypothetical protein